MRYRFLVQLRAGRVINVRKLADEIWKLIETGRKDWVGK